MAVCVPDRNVWMWGQIYCKKANRRVLASTIVCVTGTQLMNEQAISCLKGVPVMGGISFGLVSIMLLP